MDRKIIYRSFVLPGFFLVLAIINYMNLSGSELVRPILVLSLIAIGVILGVLLRNFFGFVKSSREQNRVAR